MADTISRYTRSKSDAQITRSIRVPSAAGMAAQTSATVKYLDGLDSLFKSGHKIADTYARIIEERDMRDADTYATKLFRERRIEVIQNVKGKAADGLLDREDQWQKDEFTKFCKEHKIDSKAAKQVWIKHADQYLDRTGAYMLEQQQAYDKQSRLASSDSVIDGLVDTSIGDVVSLELAFLKNAELFPNDPMLVEKQNDKAIIAQLGAWTRQNPAATIAWFNQNKEWLKKSFGQKFVNVSDMITKAENKIQAEAKHAEVLAARRDRVDAKKRKEESEKALNDFITLAVRGEADSAALYALTDNPNVSSEDKRVGFNFFKGLEAAAGKIADAEEKAWMEKHKEEVLMDIYTYGYDSPEVQTKIRTFVSYGALDTTMLSALRTEGEKLSKLRADVKPFITDAYARVKDYYTGSFKLDEIKSPRRLAQENAVRNAITTRALEHPDSIAKDFNQNDPNSWINELLRINKPVSSKVTDRDAAELEPTEIFAVLPGQSDQSFEAPKITKLTEDQLSDPSNFEPGSLQYNLAVQRSKRGK